MSRRATNFESIVSMLGHALAPLGAEVRAEPGSDGMFRTAEARLASGQRPFMVKVAVDASTCGGTLGGAEVCQVAECLWREGRPPGAVVLISGRARAKGARAAARESGVQLMGPNDAKRADWPGLVAGWAAGPPDGARSPVAEAGGNGDGQCRPGALGTDRDPAPTTAGGPAGLGAAVGRKLAVPRHGRIADAERRTRPDSASPLDVVSQHLLRELGYEALHARRLCRRAGLGYGAHLLLKLDRMVQAGILVKTPDGRYHQPTVVPPPAAPDGTGDIKPMPRPISGRHYRRAARPGPARAGGANGPVNGRDCPAALGPANPVQSR